MTVAEAFLHLEHEGRQNGNLNWLCFPHLAEEFREMARVIFEAIGHELDVEADDDDDLSMYLLMTMLHESPNDLRCCGKDYQPLRRVLTRLGHLTEELA